jgi:hypothetical protein
MKLNLVSILFTTWSICRASRFRVLDTVLRSFMIMPKLAVTSSRCGEISIDLALLLLLLALPDELITRYEFMWLGGEFGEQFDADEEELEDELEHVELVVEPDEVKLIVSKLSFVMVFEV